MRLFFVILFALVLGAALGHFGHVFVRAVDQTEFEFPAPDPDPKYVKPPRPVPIIRVRSIGARQRIR